MRRAFPSFLWSILTDIYLCHACSCHDIEDGNAWTGKLGQGSSRRPSQGRFPQYLLGEVPGDDKPGAGLVGGSSAAWFRLRTLCYQHPRLRAAFQEPPPQDRIVAGSTAARRLLAEGGGQRAGVGDGSVDV